MRCSHLRIGPSLLLYRDAVSLSYENQPTPHLPTPMNNESNDFDDDFEHAVDAYEKEDYKTAHKLFLLLAEQEDSDAQCYLGLIYANGQGVPQDYKEAGKWWELSAEQGNADAQCNLGVMYYEGQGVPEDHEEAVRWWRLAAGQRHERSQFNLEMMHNDSLDCLNSPN